LSILLFAGAPVQGGEPKPPGVDLADTVGVVDVNDFVRSEDSVIQVR
jgi:hypothetical protein